MRSPDYPVMVTLRLRVCPVPEVGAAVMMTAEVPAGVTLVVAGVELPPPQPERPAASAPVNKTSRPSWRKPNCFFVSFRLRPKAANPARPPGTQKASAGRMGFIGVGVFDAASRVAGWLPGVCRMLGSTFIAVATFVKMVSVTVMGVLLPFIVTVLLAVPPWVKEHFVYAGNEPQPNVRLPV